MRDTATYLHNLANLRALDSLNAEIDSAESIDPALTRSIAHDRRRAAEAAFTPTERAWFRRAIGASIIALAMAINVHSARADVAVETAKPAHVDSVEVIKAKREIAVARERLHDVRASERAIKAHAHDVKRAAKLRADLAKVEARIASEGK